MLLNIGRKINLILYLNYSSGNMRKNDTELNASPFFSIIITTYNRATLLKRALNSLLSQTETDWEAIIVDDESADDTYAQLLPYLASGSKIRYHLQNHRGEAITKNMGIELATGKFITFLDSDDEFEPSHLEFRKALLSQNPAVQLMHGGIKIIGNQFVPDRFDNNKKINLHDCIIGGTFFIEKNTALSLHGFNNILVGADADMFDRAVNSGVIMMETRAETYIYHHETEDSITNNLLINS